MQSFANRVALITGAGNGLGRQLALALAGEGAAIAAVDRNGDSLAALENDLKGKPVACEVADVTDRSSLRPAVDKLQERLGPVDLLIANAGIGRETSALSFHADDFEEIIRVNLIGVSNSVEAVLNGMLKRRSG